jgi:hypothetical protein
MSDKNSAQARIDNNISQIKIWHNDCLLPVLESNNSELEICRMAAIWKLQEGVKMDEATAADVAKIACALKSLSAYTSLAMDSEDAPEDLQAIVDEGLEAMARIFVW